MENVSEIINLQYAINLFIFVTRWRGAAPIHRQFSGDKNWCYDNESY